MRKKTTARKKSAQAKSSRKKTNRSKTFAAKRKSVRSPKRGGTSARIHQGVSFAPDVVTEAESSTVDEAEEYGGES